MMGGWTAATFFVIVFLLIITFFLGIYLTLSRSYKHASTVFLICGILTLPVGVLSVIGSNMLRQLSFLPTCDSCKTPLKKDSERPGHYRCPSCGNEFGMVEIKKNY
jgi:hypothetical protein